MAWSDGLMLEILEEFVSRPRPDAETLLFERYCVMRLEQRREAVRRYRWNHREEYRARDRERWKRRREKAKAATVAAGA